ncbi:BREX-1 system adenine-specific DNA-methyltransferase PglX [Bdellovibrionota bacterium FG-1]
MDFKSTLRAITLELRHELEGKYDPEGGWHPGDLERRLAAIGVRRDRSSVPVDELPHLSVEDREARRVVDAFLTSRTEADQSREAAIADFVREAAYGWANRLLALRCMEARGLIDEVILLKETYGGRSLQHQRLAKKEPERCAGEDEGLLAALFDEFTRRAKELPLLFDPKASEVALRPAVAALKRCIGLLSGTIAVKGQEAATDEVFTAPDALGWTYQYWNTEEKARVFEKVRTDQAKIQGTEIIPATCIYTDPYIVKFLVQNSLGAMWMGMNPGSHLCETWDYYVRGADRAPATKKAVSEITFLDPACGSGHFLIEAFEVFYSLYIEEAKITEPAKICASILERNLYGIDIDERAVQIAALALVMKAKEKAPDFVPRQVNIVATNIRLPNSKEHLETFLHKHPEDAPLKPALLAIFEGLSHADELGSLLQIEEPVERELQVLKAKYETAGVPMEQQGLWKEYAVPIQGKLPLGIASYSLWKQNVVNRLHQHFSAEAQEIDLATAFFGEAVSKGLSLTDMLTRRYDVIAANPPYMGSKNMGPVLKGYIQRHFPAGKRDIYAAFIMRSINLANIGGRVAVVSQQSWMFNKYFQKLRSGNPNSSVLDATSVECLAHLGPNAFADLSGEVVSAAAIVLSIHVDRRHHILAFRMTDLDGPALKAQSLADTVRVDDSKRRFRVAQVDITRLPGAPVVYWLRESLLQLIHRLKRLSSTSTVCEGLHPTDTPRFVRYWWEATNEKRWAWYSRGGEFRRWSGLNRTKIDWSVSGDRLRLTGKAIIPSADRYFTPGITYTDFASGTMAARILDASHIFSDAAPAIFPERASTQAVLATVNSRFFTVVMRALSPSPFHFRTGYVAMAPFPDLPFPTPVDPIVDCILQLARVEASRDPTEGTFRPYRIIAANSLRDAYRADTVEVEACASVLHALEGIVERKVFTAYGIENEDLAAVLDETGTPAGWYPTILGYDAFPPLPDIITLPQDLIEQIIQGARRTMPPEDLANLKRQLRELYEAGPSKSMSNGTQEGADEIEEDLDDDVDVPGAGNPIPAETFIDELSRKLQINPISIFWLLKELRDQEKVVCPSELRGFSENYVSFIVLHLLGHRQSSEQPDDNAEPNRKIQDLIIPISDGTGETKLLARVREIIAEDFGTKSVQTFEREFHESVGKHLGEWLETEFFKRHISQFKKRPIVWQLESTPGGSGKRQGRRSVRKTSAFSCLVYYQLLDSDLLPKLRTQYVGPLRVSIQTELRSLETMTSRTAEQDARRLELDKTMEELKAFDARLDQAASVGFASDSLDMLVTSEPLDKWISQGEQFAPPVSKDAFLAQERKYDPGLNDGVRVNIAPLQRAGLLTTDILSKKDVEKALSDRAEWRADERRWCREGKLPRPGWWDATGVGR